MKKINVLLIAIMVVGIVLSGCSQTTQTVDTQQIKETERLQRESQSQIGMPNIKNFYEKKMAKEIYELRDDAKLITYAYMQNLEGKFIFLGQTVGFGLPYSTQFSNPEKYVDDPNGSTGAGSLVLPQPEPNGLFVPEGLSATWLQYINPETGKREIIYAEPNIIVTQSKLPRRLVAEWSIPENY